MRINVITVDISIAGVMGNTANQCLTYFTVLNYNNRASISVFLLFPSSIQNELRMSEEIMSNLCVN